MTDMAAARADVFTPDALQDPHGLYRTLREETPVRQVLLPHGLKAWLITRHADVLDALTDSRLRKNVRSVLERNSVEETASEGFVDELADNLLSTDPPDHTRLRSLVGKAFTARRIAELRPRIEEITDHLLDDLPDSGEVDLLTTFAQPLPVFVICELLGVPTDDRATFVGWSNRVISAEGGSATREDGLALRDFLRELIAAKRAEPGDDLISALVEARDDGDRLNERELVSMCFVLLVAGIESTVHLICNSVVALLRHPEQLAALRDDPSLLTRTIEEVIRYDGPVNTATVRYAAEDVAFGDVVIPAGDLVLVSPLSANRDPDFFPEPDRFDITRSTHGHLGFGHGIHFCLGASLARLEGEVALGRLLEAYPGIRLTPDHDRLPYRYSPIVRGLQTFPVRL